MSLTRRHLVLGLSALGLPALLGACATLPETEYTATPVGMPGQSAALGRYGEIEDNGFVVPGVDLSAIDPQFYRQVVAFTGRETPGTVVVDPDERFLYLVQPGGQALRYGVGVGREGFGWNGAATVRRKATWPTWTPPSQMIQRQPELAEHAAGMPGGLDNPLGARALYLYQGDRDTLYRIHGTNEPETIGTQVSSGCIRMINQYAIDLYGRVPTGSRVVVRPHMSA